MWRNLAQSMTKVTALGVAAVLLASCAKVQSVNTFDTMLTSSAIDGGHATTTDRHLPTQTRFLAANGFLPITGPGDTCMASQKRPASGFICFSGSGLTEVAVRKYDFNGDIGDVSKIAGQLQQLQVNILQLASLDAATPNTKVGSVPQAPVAQQQQDLKDTAQEVIAAVETVKQEAENANFFVYRWSGAEKAAGSGLYGAVLGGGAGGQRKESGLVIVGGLTVAQLNLGLKDAKAILQPYPKASAIATYTIGAEHLVYISGLDLSAALSAKLDGSVSSLKELSPETKAAIDAYASLGRAFETQGAFSAAEVDRVSLQEYAELYGSQHVFYTNMTDVKTLLRALDD